MTRDGDDEELGGIAALARRLPREIQPPPDLWERIAAGLEPPGELDHLAASLPAQIDPPKDLWPNIEARIAPGRRMRRTALAFAALIVFAATVAIGVRLGVPRGAGPERASTPLAADTANGGASPGRNLAWVLGAPAVAQDVAANLSRELALVRDERLSIERAIAKEPDNVDLRELWAFTYETELELADAVGRTVMEYQRLRG